VQHIIYLLCFSFAHVSKDAYSFVVFLLLFRVPNTFIFVVPFILFYFVYFVILAI